MVRRPGHHRGEGRRAVRVRRRPRTHDDPRVGAGQGARLRLAPTGQRRHGGALAAAGDPGLDLPHPDPRRMVRRRAGRTDAPGVAGPFGRAQAHPRAGPSLAADEDGVSLLDELADRIAGLPPRRARVAVDGVDGSGKSTFAVALAAVVRLQRPVVESTVDGFHHPRQIRYRRGRDSPDGFFEDSYDYRALRRCLLDPFAPGGDGRFRRAVFDHRTDQPIDESPEWAAPDAVLILDGLFLHRPELRESWDYSIFLRVGFAETYARMAVRNGCPSNPDA